MFKKEQYEKDFENYRHQIKISDKQMLAAVGVSQQHKEDCLNQSNNSNSFADCMEKYENKIAQIATSLSIKVLFTERQALECYKQNQDDREYNICHQQVNDQLQNSYNEYFQALQQL